LSFYKGSNRYPRGGDVLQQLDPRDAAIAILINLINIPPDAVGNNSRQEFPLPTDQDC